ncbi:baseplate wedge subunit and tail pin [Paraglaciecola Antarctic GD virus 1]|nr:baseplate wedge subunit and tail pin [Paraglaciecola Antarctic GD virus 1]
MKHIIKLGSTVDDLTGDYLRKGGEKINSNFNETYDELGDGEKLYPAGAWRTHSVANDGSTLIAEFGDAIIIDTVGGSCTVVLPQNPTPSDYGKVIKIKDVKGTWVSNPVVLQAGSGDHVGGTASDEVLNTPYASVVLTLADGGLVSYDFKYVKGVTIDSVPQAGTGDTILKKTFLLTSDQADFLDVFGVNYNIENLEVFKNGNELYYGEPDTLPPTADSDYGSIGGGGALTPLNGSNVRLRVSGKAGDVIMFKTYLASIGAVKTTYQAFNVVLSSTAGTDTNGEKINNVGTDHVLTMAQLGAGGLQYNPGTVEVYIDGEKVPQKDSNGSANNVTPFSYEVSNPSGVYSQILLFGTISGDQLVEVKWLNGNIGSTLEYEGLGGIQEKTDERYMKTDAPVVSRTNKISYPNAGVGDTNTTGVGSPDAAIRFSDVNILFDTIYPIGTIYKNAANPANPADYMGFGTWVVHSAGKVEIGYEAGDTVFGVHTATGGSFDKTIISNNLPVSNSGTESYIKVDPDGDIDLTGCNTDPNSSPLVVKAAPAEVGNEEPTALDITPAFVVVYSWRRIL